MVSLTSDICSTGTNQQRLVVDGDVFVLNETYEFMVEVWSDNFDIPGYSKLRLAPNPPPVGGQCTANASDVYGLEPISVSCTGYFDPNGVPGMPLNYKFYASNPVNPGQKTLLYQGQDGQGIFYLSPWNETEIRVCLVVEVTDAEKATTEALRM